MGNPAVTSFIPSNRVIMGAKVSGDTCEDLLERNAGDVISGAGEYYASLASVSLYAKNFSHPLTLVSSLIFYLLAIKII